MTDRPEPAGSTEINIDRIHLTLLLVLLGIIAGCSASPTGIPVQQAAMDDRADANDHSRLEHRENGDGISSIDPTTIALDRFHWRFGGFDGHVLITPNYEIRTTATRDDFVEHLPLFFEAALAHYTTYLGTLPKPRERMETFLFQDRRQWAAKTREVLPQQSNIFESLGRGGFATQGTAVLYYIDHPRSRSSNDTFSIAAHEGWHQYTQTTFRNPLPIWLEEGIATYMESFRVSPEGQPRFSPWRNWERSRQLRQAHRQDHLIPLSEILRRSPQSFLETGKSRLLVYYAQVWALARFLAEGNDGQYREALEELLHDAATGKMVGRLSSSDSAPSRAGRRLSTAATRSGPWIILEYFNSDLSAFEQEYLEFIDDITGRGRR